MTDGENFCYFVGIGIGVLFGASSVLVSGWQGGAAVLVGGGGGCLVGLASTPHEDGIVSKGTLTEQEWKDAFTLRCQVKRGMRPNDEQFALFMTAFKADPERYRAMGDEVFRATAPFGSTTRRSET